MCFLLNYRKIGGSRLLTQVEISKLETWISSVLIDEFDKQGHTMPKPKWQQSVETVGKMVSGNLIFTLTGADYGKKYVNVKMDRAKASFKQFPFLLEYFKNRGVSGEKDQKTRAAMTIRSWMKQCRPSSGSFQYSKTGKRTEFIEAAETKIANDFGDIFATISTKEIQLFLEKIIRDLNQSDKLKFTISV